MFVFKPPRQGILTNLVFNIYHYCVLDTHLYKRNAVLSKSGRLELISENLTYDVQLPIDSVKSGMYD